MIAWLVKNILYYWFKSGIYGWWSNLYTSIAERGYKDVPLSTFPNFLQIHVRMWNYMHWTRDSIWMLGDAVSTAEKVEYKALYGDGFVGDCDDFARWICLVINKSMTTGEWEEGRILTHMMSVIYSCNRFPWAEGHFVALLARKDTSGVLEYGWIDYEAPHWGFKHIKDAAVDVVRACNGSKPLTIALMDPNTLDTIAVERG